MDETKSLVMSRAADLRAAGVSPSEALEEAWAEAEDWNPLEEMLVEAPNPPRRRSTRKAEEGGVSIVLLLGAAVVAYYLIKKEWPWQTIQGIRRKQIAARQAALEAKKNDTNVIDPWSSSSRTVIPLHPNGDMPIQLIIP